MMAVGFVDPAAGLGVGGQRRSIDALRGKHWQVAGVGAEAGAVLADVRIRAGALGGSAQSVAAGEAGFDRRGVPLVRATGDVDQRQTGPAGISRNAVRAGVRGTGRGATCPR